MQVDDYCLCRRFAEESGVLAAAQAKDLGVVQAAPMYRGMLYNAGAHADKCPEVTAMIGGMADWASARGYALPDLAVQFPARHPALSTCIMGARSAAEVIVYVARVELSENAPAVRAVDAVADGEAARVRAQRRTRTTGSPGRYSSLS